jgi:FtsH-binding integral membrane protein
MNNSQMPGIYNVQSAETQSEIQRGFITRVYGWMTFGLVVTTVIALATMSIPGLMKALVSNSFLFFGLIIGELALVIGLSAAINRLNSVTAGMLFTVYAALNGVTLSLVLLAYTGASVASTFGITAATFGIMTLFGYTTQRDLTKMGSLLMMALLGLIVASVVNIFLQSSPIYWLITFAGVLIFVGLTAYDTQKLKNMALGMEEGSEQMSKASIIGALRLYLDFINLFLMLLRLTGRRR